MSQMKRRSFLAAAASLLPASALAFDLRSGSDGRGERDEPLGSGRLSKMLFRGEGNRQFGLSNLLVLAESGAWYADFRTRVVRRDEDRIGILHDIPLVGDLFAPRLRGSDFNAGRQIGLTFQLDDTLLIDLHRSELARRQLAQQIVSSQQTMPALTLPNAPGPVRSVGAANQKISYFLIGGPAPVSSSQPPKPLRSLANGAEATQIGAAYNNGEALLALVRPSILNGWR